MSPRKLRLVPSFLAALTFILCPKFATPQETAGESLPTISARIAWQAAYFIDGVHDLSGAEPVDITGDFEIGDPITAVKPDLERLAAERPELLARLEELGHVPVQAILSRDGRVTNVRFEEDVDPDVRTLFAETLREARFEPTRHYRRGPVFVRLSIDYYMERDGAQRGDPGVRNEVPVSSEDLEQRIANAYYLDSSRALDLLPPPHPPERMFLYQTGAPSQSKAIPAGPKRMNILWEDDRPTYGGACFGGCDRLEDLLRALGIPAHAVRFDGALDDVRIEADLFMRSGATTDELLADLELALLEKFGLDVALDLRSEMMPTLVFRGSFGEVAADPNLEQPVLDVYTDRKNPEPGVGAGVGGVTQLKDAAEVLEHQLGVFVADETDGPAGEPILITIHDSSFGTERLELLIQNVEAQTDLEIHVEDRPHDVLYVTERAGT